MKVHAQTSLKFHEAWGLLAMSFVYTTAKDANQQEDCSLFIGTCRWALKGYTISFSYTL